MAPTCLCMGYGDPRQNVQPGLQHQQRLGRCFYNANSCRDTPLCRVFPAREPSPWGFSVSQASLCGMRPQGTMEGCQARIVSQKLGVQGCFLPQSQLPSKVLCLPGVGGWGLRRASRREVRTLRKFRKDRGVQFSRGRRTLCFAGERAGEVPGPGRARPQARARRSLKGEKDADGRGNQGPLQHLALDSALKAEQP